MGSAGDFLSDRLNLLKRLVVAMKTINDDYQLSTDETAVISRRVKDFEVRLMLLRNVQQCRRMGPTWVPRLRVAIQEAARTLRSDNEELVRARHFCDEEEQKLKARNDIMSIRGHGKRRTFLVDDIKKNFDIGMQSNFEAGAVEADDKAIVDKLLAEKLAGRGDEGKDTDSDEEDNDEDMDPALRPLSALPEDVESEEQVNPEPLLDELREQKRAEEELEKALASKDVPRIRSMIAECQRKGLVSSITKMALQAVLEEDLIQAMDEAVANKDIDALEQAMKVWMSEGLDGEVYLDAEESLEELQEEELQNQLERQIRTPVLFENDGVAISAAGRATLQETLQLLKQYPSIVLEVQGCSTHVREDVAVEMARQRAECVQYALRHSGCKNPMSLREWKFHGGQRRRCALIFPLWKVTPRFKPRTRGMAGDVGLPAKSAKGLSGSGGSSKVPRRQGILEQGASFHQRPSLQDRCSPRMSAGGGLSRK